MAAPPLSGPPRSDGAASWFAAALGVAAAAGLLLRIAGFVHAAIVVTALAHLALGLVTFTVHGRARATASGLYLLASAVLLGGSSLIIGGRTEYPDALWVVLAATLVANGAVAAVVWRFGAGARLAAAGPVALADGLVPFLLGAGACYLAGGLILEPHVPAALSQGLGYDGAAMLATGGALAVRWRTWLWSTGGATVAAGAIAVYVSAFFSGGGRLNLATLVMVPAVVLAAWLPTRWFKRLVLVAIVPALVLAGSLRLMARYDGTAVSPADVILEGDGIGSVTIGVENFAQLTTPEASGARYPRQWGKTYLGAAVGLVPRAWWPGKPLSLGADLVAVFHPVAKEGASTTALSAGEWFVNFGWPGLALSVPVLALGLLVADRLLLAGIGGAVTRRRAIVAMIGALLAVGLFDYAWGGSFTFVSRGGARIVLLLPLLAVAGLAGGQDARREPAAAEVAGDGAIGPRR